MGVLLRSIESTRMRSVCQNFPSVPRVPQVSSSSITFDGFSLCLISRLRLVTYPANHLMLKVALNSQEREQVKLAHVFSSVSIMSGFTISFIGAAAYENSE